MVSVDLSSRHHRLTGPTQPHGRWESSVPVARGARFGTGARHPEVGVPAASEVHDPDSGSRPLAWTRPVPPRTAAPQILSAESPPGDDVPSAS